MTDFSRREALGIMAAVPVAQVLDLTPPVLERAMRAAEDAVAGRDAGGAPFTPKFFTAHEWRSVRMLADYIIPRDERSGSATDAGVPEFMDFIMIDRPTEQTWMRGGLAWLDIRCGALYGKRFIECTLAQRSEMLDAIAYPRKAKPDASQGVEFFNRLRDLTASGFYTSKMGIKDLQYMGNMMLTEWKGCPDAALKKLGVSY